MATLPKPDRLTELCPPFPHRIAFARGDNPTLVVFSYELLRKPTSAITNWIVVSEFLTLPYSTFS